MTVPPKPGGSYRRSLGEVELLPGALWWETNHLTNSLNACIVIDGRLAQPVPKTQAFNIWLVFIRVLLALFALQLPGSKLSAVKVSL